MSESSKTKCPVHPKYKGRKKPKYCSNENCICSKIWLRRQRHKVRVKHMPTRPMKDKSKYTRKVKHKKKEEDDV